MLVPENNLSMLSTIYLPSHSALQSVEVSTYRLEFKLNRRNFTLRTEIVYWKSKQSLEEVLLQTSLISSLLPRQENRFWIQSFNFFLWLVLQIENAIKINDILVHFPRNEHWSDSMWSICNISSIIMSKYINRDLCIVEPRDCFWETGVQGFSPSSDLH